LIRDTWYPPAIIGRGASLQAIGSPFPATVGWYRSSCRAIYVPFHICLNCKELVNEIPNEVAARKTIAADEMLCLQHLLFFFVVSIFQSVI
jgi:hypothetical protein